MAWLVLVSASPTTKPRHTTAILTIVLLSYLMIVLDISIVITALPRMREGLGFSATGHMVLLGIGQGASLGPLTAAGIARVTPDDAGAASGLVNVAHQLGGSLGLGILVTVFAAASSPTLSGSALLAHRVSAALTVGACLLALALVVVLALIGTPPGRRPTSATIDRTGEIKSPPAVPTERCEPRGSS